MLKFDSLGIFKNHIDLYKDFSLPVFLCDDGFKVYWSNLAARRLFPHLTVENGLDPLLAEFSAETFRARLKSGMACRVDGAVGFSGECLNLLPVLQEGALMGVLAILAPFCEASATLGAAQMSKTPEILESQVRQSIDGIFKEMDGAAAKADIMGAGWVKSSFDSIAQSSYHILRLVSNLSVFAMYQSAPPLLEIKRIDFFSWICEFESIVSEISQKMGVPVTFRMPDAPAFVGLDLEKFELAFFNIVNNALYFTQVQNRVEIVGRDGVNAVRLTVRDHGIGIPADILPLVTRPYFSCGRYGEPVGAGLGLTISKLITEALGGAMTVESQESKGTAVTVTLPKHAFSSPLPLHQGGAGFSLSNRFSGAYVGLMDALTSPYFKS